MSETTVHWFRRDLRLADNEAFKSAAAAGPVVPVYIDDPAEKAGAASRWWLDRSLRSLEAALKKKGLTLIVRRGEPVAELEDVLERAGAGRLTFNTVFEPKALRVERAVLQQIGGEAFNGALLYRPEEVKTLSGTPFKVFTPFWRKAREREPRRPAGHIRKATGISKKIPSLKIDALGLAPKIPWDKGLRDTWEPGEAGAAKALKGFLKKASGDYSEKRDVPGVVGTSRLSPHLHFGEIAPERVWWEHVEGGPSPERQDAYLNELGWREFAHYVLFHFPRTVDAPMDERFENFPWRRSARDAAAWRKGLTGFPIVDAGMRELWSTGWMHNRVRMVVASFFVKHLGLDWRDGARWFWDTLVDADLAANTLGWQWSAGCGADAAPYFRVFNPIIQGEKFDAKGDYVRRWVPELKGVPDRFLHKPWEAPEPPADYPAPIVEHAVGRARALGLYERWKGKPRIRS
jgi:deoxyribodipyrimidine photo-lyase